MAFRFLMLRPLCRSLIPTPVLSIRHCFFSPFLPLRDRSVRPHPRSAFLCLMPVGAYSSDIWNPGINISFWRCNLSLWHFLTLISGDTQLLCVAALAFVVPGIRIRYFCTRIITGTRFVYFCTRLC